MKKLQMLIRALFVLPCFVIIGCSSNACDEVHLGFQDWGDGSADVSVVNFSKSLDPVQIEILLVQDDGSISTNKTVRLAGGGRHDERVVNHSMDNVKVLCEGEPVDW